LLRISGFRLSGERLPAGDDKARLLRAIAGAEPVLPLVVILRIVGMTPARYHAWQRATEVCGLDDPPSCPRSMPSRLTCEEVATIKEMVLDPGLPHMPLRTLSLFAQRAGKVFVSVTTWARLVHEHGWRRPRTRVHPAKPTLGVRASRPNEYWHVDVTVLKLLDGTKTFPSRRDRQLRPEDPRLDPRPPPGSRHGQTPDEMYLGTASSLPDDLVVARGKTRERRLAVNRAASCHRCAPATARAGGSMQSSVIP
jgi:hypothetical protein